MADYITSLTSVLGISLDLGTMSFTLGGLAIASIILAAGVGFFKSLKGRR